MIGATIKASDARRAKLLLPYSPAHGTGSLIPRVDMPLMPDRAPIRVPAAMQGERLYHALCDHGSIAHLAEAARTTTDVVYRRYVEVRSRHDFEFWAWEAAKIKDKKGHTIAFTLNRPQRIYAARMEAQRQAGQPVRIIVLKHRQWGCTTMSYTYIGWHQLCLYTGRDAWFVGLDLDGARDVVERYEKMLEGHSESLAPVSLTGYGGSTKTKQIAERGCTVSVGTVERPNAPSGRPAQFVHLFEVGKWPSNQSVSADRVAQNVGAMLVDEPGTISIIESTAQAETGTYFMDTCLRAQQEESSKFLFVSWTDDPQYMEEVADKPGFIRRWLSEAKDERQEYMQMLWQRGCCLEQIAWYVTKMTSEHYADWWRLKEEFPTTPEEAFQTGGKRKFPQSYVEGLRAGVRAPRYTGQLVGKAATGDGALTDVRFEQGSGDLQVWESPGDDLGGKLEYPVANRYVIGMDVGGVWEGADYTVMRVLDRAPLLLGGVPEIVAEWHGHIDHDLGAWVAAQLATWYEDALLAVEVNSLREDYGDPSLGLEPDHGLATLDVIKAYYGNLYTRKAYDNEVKDWTYKVGFHTNKATKPVIIANMVSMVRDGGYIERCHAALGEMSTYMQHEDGTMGAASKRKDDRVMATAIMLKVHDEMDAPTYIKPVAIKPAPVGAATF